MPSNNINKVPALGAAVVPHPPLTHYYADEAARASWVRDVFDRTAGDYDRIEHLMAFGTGSWYRHEALLRAGLAPNMDVLDVGTGTGLTAVEAIAIVGDAARVIGVDPSPGMLAASKVPPASPKLVGGAENLPVDAASVDFVTMGYALRHVADLPTVFAEFQRVLRPGGRLCVLEITRPRSRLGVLGLKIYMRGIVPVLARLFGHSREMPALMRYYWDTIEACVPPETVLKQLQEAGFSQVHRHMVGPIFSEYQAVKPA